MKYSLACVCSLLSISVWAASSLDIPAGATHTITPDQQRLTLDSLTIGDGATITFAEGVKQWQLRSDRTHIGDNVTIEASGKTGSDGQPGQGYRDTAQECTSGRDASDGSDGGRGGDAVAVRMQLGLVSLGDLRIVSNGGSGGAGGVGGDGEAAGGFATTCKNAPDGGDAGNGGDGGDGGSGGDVAVQYWLVSNTLNPASIPDRIKVEANTGNGGAAGKKGEPGAGSEGRYIQKRTLSGDRAWVGGGKEGEKGKPGSVGREGLAGRVVIEQALVTVPVAAQAVNTPSAVKAVPAPTPSAQPATSKDEEIKAIKESLKALMERLDKLETE